MYWLLCPTTVIVGHKSIHSDEWPGLFHEKNRSETDFMSPFPVCSDDLSLLVVPLALSRSDCLVKLSWLHCLDSRGSGCLRGHKQGYIKRKQKRPGGCLQFLEIVEEEIRIIYYLYQAKMRKRLFFFPLFVSCWVNIFEVWAAGQMKAIKALI